MERLAGAWQWSLALSWPREEGAVEPFVLLPGCLDEPLLAVGHGGRVRCFSNVCTHRARVLVEAPAQRTHLRCGYHGRRFGLDGRCLGAAGFDHLPCEGPSADDLPELSVGRLGPLGWVCLAPEAPWHATMDPLLARLPALPWSRLQRDPEGARTFEVRAHWALYCENYLEGLHIPYVHPTLSRRLELSRYRTEAHPWGVLQVGHDRGEGAGLPEDPRAPGAPVAAYYVFLFPNTMVNIYPWGVSLNVVTPLGLDRTRVDFDAWVWSPELRGVGAGDGLATVEDEDERVVEAVQRGVRARLYAGGRLAPGWEDGVGAFHRWLSGAYRATGKGAK